MTPDSSRPPPHLEDTVDCNPCGEARATACAKGGASPRINWDAYPSYTQDILYWAVFYKRKLDDEHAEKQRAQARAKLNNSNQVGTQHTDRPIGHGKKTRQAKTEITVSRSTFPGIVWQLVTDKLVAKYSQAMYKNNPIHQQLVQNLDAQKANKRVDIVKKTYLCRKFAAEQCGLAASAVDGEFTWELSEEQLKKVVPQFTKTPEGTRMFSVTYKWAQKTCKSKFYYEDAMFAFVACEREIKVPYSGIDQPSELSNAAAAAPDERTTIINDAVQRRLNHKTFYENKNRPDRNEAAQEVNEIPIEIIDLDEVSPISPTPTPPPKPRQLRSRRAVEKKKKRHTTQSQSEISQLMSTMDPHLQRYSQRARVHAWRLLLNPHERDLLTVLSSQHTGTDFAAYVHESILEKFPDNSWRAFDETG